MHDQQPNLWEAMPTRKANPRKTAMEAAYDAASEAFKESYEALLMTFVESGRAFTAEEVTDTYRSRKDLPQPDEWRSVGGMYQRLTHKKVIRKVGYAIRNQGNAMPVYVKA